MKSPRSFRVGIINTHPIQYYVPWYKRLAQETELEVFYCYQQTAVGQAAAGFGVQFEWDIPLLEGYSYRFLENRSAAPNVDTFSGCDTPDIGDIIRAKAYDAFIVHGWYVKSFWQAIRACWQQGIPVLVRGDSQLLTPRNRFWQLCKYPIYRSFLSRFDGYLVVGERSRQYYLHYGADPERLFFAPHSVDNEFFAQQSAQWRVVRDEVRASFGLPGSALVALFAGKLIAKKRPLDFVRAIAQARRTDERICGLIAGDGPLRTELAQVIQAEKLPIVFAGFLNQTEIPRAYAASDVLVLPSDGGETWGLVVNEAMASGLPALVSDQVGCGPDLVIEDQTGYAFPCGEVAQLAANLVRLAADRQKTQTMGNAARELIEAYSIARAAEATLAAISRVSQHNDLATVPRLDKKVAPRW